MKKTGRIINCLMCGKEKYFAAWQFKRKNYGKYCSNKCRIQAKIGKSTWASIHFKKGMTTNTGRTHFKKGMKITWKIIGKKGSDNPSWKGGKIEIICKFCGKPKKVWPYQLKKTTAKYCNYSCYWKDMDKGITKLIKHIRASHKYFIWRIKIFLRDKKQCIICRSKKEIEADHYPLSLAQLLVKYKIKTFKQALQTPELWNIDTARTLCHECHVKTFTYRKRLRFHPIQFVL